jgi:hypothetical protein
MIHGRPHLPFQLQTEYTTADGSVLVRVITKVKPITEDRQVAERGRALISELRGVPSFCMLLDLDMDVMGFHALRASASLAAEGRFSEARTGAIASQRMMKRSLERSRLNIHVYMLVHGQKLINNYYHNCIYLSSCYTYSSRNTVKKASYNRSISSIAPLEKTLREQQLRVRLLLVRIFRICVCRLNTCTYRSEVCQFPRVIVLVAVYLVPLYDQGSSLSHY